MNRILKFRIWNKKFEKFREPFEFKDLRGYEGEGGAHTLTNDETLTSNEILNEDLVFQQFTGLQDKNSVDIYEGDILLRESANFNYKYEVFWDTPEGSWKLKFLEEPLDCSIYLGDFSQKNLEVIGNIYENK